MPVCLTSPALSSRVRCAKMLIVVSSLPDTQDNLKTFHVTTKLRATGNTCCARMHLIFFATIQLFSVFPDLNSNLAQAQKSHQCWKSSWDKAGQGGVGGGVGCALCRLSALSPRPKTHPPHPTAQQSSVESPPHFFHLLGLDP